MVLAVGANSDSKLEQIQHRLVDLRLCAELALTPLPACPRVTSCETHWPELRRWFHQFRNLTSINANQEIGMLLLLTIF